MWVVVWVDGIGGWIVDRWGWSMVNGLWWTDATYHHTNQIRCLPATVYSIGYFVIPVNPLYPDLEKSRFPHLLLQY